MLGAALLAAVSALAPGTGCGGALSSSARSGSPDTPPIELRLRTSDGHVLDLARMRGKPVILFVFATFDGASQASVRSLALFLHDFPDTNVVGVAAQYGAKELIDAWVYALAPPFPVAYEPDDEVARGVSDLGEIDAVPTFIALDARGVVVDRLVGFVSEQQLVDLLRRAGG